MIGSAKSRSLLAATVLLLVAGACSEAELLPQVQRSGRSGDEREFGATEATPEPDDAGSDGEAHRSASSDKLLTFAVLGDFGIGSDAQLSVAQRMCRYRQHHPYDLVLTTGDNIYPSGEPKYFRSRFKRPYSCLMGDGVRFRATLGNHDVITANGRYELDDPAFGMPWRNYVFRRAGVRFVMVNSNQLNLDWIRAAVKPQEGDLFTVVAMHHPIYSPGAHGSTPGFRPDLPRIFERHGVDLVFAGHDHLYAVTKQLDGIRYVVTGGGGAPTYDCHEQWFVDRCYERYHFMFVRVGAESLVVRAIPASGTALHEFTLIPAE